MSSDLAVEQSFGDILEVTHVEIGNMRVALAGREELVRLMEKDCCGPWRDLDSGSRLVFDANGHALALYNSDASFREAVNCADIVHADGGFVVSLSKRVTGHGICERSATTDMIHDFARSAEQNGLTFFLLGGEESENAKAAGVLKQRYPKLMIVGRHHGFFSKEEEAEIISHINDLKPDILWVGLGKTREQIFSARNRNKIHARWIVTCGGCFNYISGRYSRAPLRLQKANLEWLYRAVSEKRLFWRYLTTSPVALWFAWTRSSKKTFPTARKLDL